MSRRWSVYLGIWLGASLIVSCTDPVVDNAIAQLGEDPGEPGPEHRPGQPCVLCHQSGGPAKAHFAVAGTIYDTPDPKTAKGVEGVQILLVDSGGTYPRVPVLTNKAGNFYVKEEDWPTLQFPMHAKIYKDATHGDLMQSQIGREPSCAGCHHDPRRGVSDDQFGALGHIYLGGSN